MTTAEEQRLIQETIKKLVGRCPSYPRQNRWRYDWGLRCEGLNGHASLCFRTYTNNKGRIKHIIWNANYDGRPF